MASGTFFVRGCPTCGRKLEIRVELLGRDVECIHCGGIFNSNETKTHKHDDQEIDQILARAQQYIQSSQSIQAIDPAAAKLG